MREKIHFMYQWPGYPEDSPEVTMAIAGGHAILEKLERILVGKTYVDMTLVIVNEPLVYTAGDHGQMILGEK